MSSWEIHIRMISLMVDPIDFGLEIVDSYHLLRNSRIFKGESMHFGLAVFVRWKA